MWDRARLDKVIDFKENFVLCRHTIEDTRLRTPDRYSRERRKRICDLGGRG
jgi:hypothetical protein